jgi:uncharacterized protein YraI
VTDNVVIRSGPGTSYQTLGNISSGTTVTVTCTALGETITDKYGPDSHWDQVSYNGVTGYVTDEFVNTQGAEKNPSLIPAC